MPNSNRIHITGTRGNWHGVREGNERASFTTDNKEDAIQRGRELAKKDHGELIIHGQDNLIQEERSYGHDPYPPEG